jgi:hypothetical protein
MEQSLGVEPSCDFAGNEVSHHVTLRIWYLPLDSNQLPSAYRADAHPHELGRQKWSGRQDLHLRPPSSKLGRLLLTYALKVWSGRHESNVLGRAPEARGQPMTHAQIVGHPDWSCTSIAALCRRAPRYSATG